MATAGPSERSSRTMHSRRSTERLGVMVDVDDTARDAWRRPLTARGMDNTRPGAQLVLFLVLVVVVALPAYTSAPQRWAGIGVVLWAAVVLLLSFRPRGLGR